MSTCNAFFVVQDMTHEVAGMDEDSLLASAQLVHSQVPIRLARIIRSLQSLPFIMGVNPYINDVYHIYWDAFQAGARNPSPLLSMENAMDAKRHILVYAFQHC